MGGIGGRLFEYNRLDAEVTSSLMRERMGDNFHFDKRVDQLVAHVKSRYGAPWVPEIDLIPAAYHLAADAHQGQRRDEGIPYLIHPLRVASIVCFELGIVQPEMIAAAILHDTLEDDQHQGPEDHCLTWDEIVDDTSERVAQLVGWLSKPEHSTHRQYLEDLEFSGDQSGAVYIKLADRLDNIRHIVYGPDLNKVERYIAQTEKYYLPLADRFSPYIATELRWTIASVKATINNAKEANAALKDIVNYSAMSSAVGNHNRTPAYLQPVGDRPDGFNDAFLRMLLGDQAQ